MNGKLLKVITSILIILTMTIGNFALLFANAITYAANASTEALSSITISAALREDTFLSLDTP